jgi:hypothetical protein
MFIKLDFFPSSSELRKMVLCFQVILDSSKHLTFTYTKKIRSNVSHVSDMQPLFYGDWYQGSTSQGVLVNVFLAIYQNDKSATMCTFKIKLYLDSKW